MTLKDLKALHDKVVHVNKDYSERELTLEERWVKRYPYDVLSVVCEECFGRPDRAVSPNDLVLLNFPLPKLRLHYAPPGAKIPSNVFEMYE